ncbi:hypothetical protein [Xenorhabdus griffiniae]|uniref:hypothetical protein n=1 Tax=Xenorhabdus griffiniae TaxID=351672 RepID=UPI0023594250|nr:hypothetical protein [Xenorhabdus griffiniae]MDC9607224.1 hypothetical protein [Xenorhabdus griffiniae]
MAGLPVSIGARGGTWAMVGLSSRVPVQSVQAAQSPLNIMWGNYAKLAVALSRSQKPGKAARIA